MARRDAESERRARREARERSSGGATSARRAGRRVRPALQPAPSQAGGRELPMAGARRFIRESIGELRKVEWPGQNQVIQGTVVVIIACVDRRRRTSTSATRSSTSSSARSSSGSRRTQHVPVVRDQHLLRAREQGEGQSRAPDRLDEPAHALPPRRRPDRAGDRDEGRPEGAGREARPPGLRAREHGPERRRLDGREEHAGRDRLRRRRLEARAALAGRGRPDPAHRRRHRRASAHAGRVLARRVGEGDLRPAVRLRRRDRRGQPRRAEAQGARRHLRAPGSGRARLRPGQEDRLGRWRRKS